MRNFIVVCLAVLIAGCVSQTISSTETVSVHTTGENATYNRTTIIMPTAHPYPVSPYYGVRGRIGWFGCNNGLRVQVQYVSPHQIMLGAQFSNQLTHATLSLAPTGVGGRYVANIGLWGRGTEWIEARGTAKLYYTGNDGLTHQTICYER